MGTITNLSKHAEKNSQRRSFRYTDQELFDLYADEVYVGRGCYRLFFPTLTLKGLIAEGAICRQQADRLAKKYKIQDGQIDVTVANICSGKKNNFKKWRNGRTCAVIKGRHIMGFM